MKRVLIGSAAVLGLSGAAVAQEQLFALLGNIAPQVLRLDPSNGSVLDGHPVSGQQALFGGLAADNTGTLFSIDGYNDPDPDRLFRIDSATGAGTLVGPTGFNWNFRSVTWDPSTSTLYAATDNSLYTVDRVTGAATLLYSISAPNLDQLTALAADGHGNAYFTDIGNTDLFRLDLATHQATFIGSVGGSGNWFQDLAFDSSGRLWGARLDSFVYTIDLATAAATSRYSGNYTGLVFTGGAPACYANCDGSTTPPALNINDFVCFQSLFAAGDSVANCDGSTTPPTLNINDFVCFQSAFAAGCP
jgi:hypothetical protein